jgi:Tetratricopeptide repeat
MNTMELGSLALKRGDYQEAVNIFKRLLDREKGADAFFGFGVAHYHLGDIPTARWAFYQALDLNRDHKEALAYIERIDKMKKQQIPGPKRKTRFRTLRDHFEIFDVTWKGFFIKGINIGLGLPGCFPGEFAVKKGTYLKWFKQIIDLGANTIRVYTILQPEFYEMLYRFNARGQKLYLLQEIWTELPEGNDFQVSIFAEGLRQEIKLAVDVIFGNATLPERPGHPHGKYEYDISPLLAGFIMGREWESCAVKSFNEARQRQAGDFHGAFLQIQAGTPFEVWITEMCDFLQSYEYENYHVTHPVTTVNWPTLDPLEHPSESSYEDEFKIQGLLPQGYQGPCIDVHIEDAESLDVAKISSIRGNGFFALYHAYPYYPDFMNNDYIDQENPYLAYLAALKKHHGRQPVLIAEFGVPSSRETAHWNRCGWHHGGHGDREQGEINGKLMQTINEADMAGGVLFSWADEWFKRNWLFLPAELPAERKPLWYNLQDPEENYGLLAAYPGYPGKKVNLACRPEDWHGIEPLYEKKKEDAMAFLFHDQSDDVRRLERLCVQHDEGFLYILIETSGMIDFSCANYLVGLDTSSTDGGERALPFGTNVVSPIGLTFLVHLGGKENSRILAAASYDKYLNDKTGIIKPEASDQGAWVMMQNETNIRRISKDGKRFFPAHVFTMSKLRFGSLDPKREDYHSLADFFVFNNKVELRIPWGLINITDPSSRSVLWMDKNGATKQTGGIRIFAISYKPEEGKLVACGTGGAFNHTDSLPGELTPSQLRNYSWKGWETPIYHSYLKESYYRYQKVLKAISEER